MKHLFRIPPWYKFTILSIYAFSSPFILNQNFYNLSYILKILIAVIYTVIGIWILSMWNKNILVDLDKKEIIIGKAVIKFEDIESFEIRPFYVKFYSREGTIKFPYPIEDPDVLGRYIRGERSEDF